MIKGHLNKETLFYWSLLLVVITLPLPKYSLNSQSIIFLSISWLAYSPIKEKLKNLRRNFSTFLLLSSFFWISLLGLLYTQDLNEGLKNLQKSLPFFILPLIVLSINLTKKDIYVIVKYFSYTVIIASLFALAKAFFFTINNLGDYYYFDQLKRLLNKHTTYYSIFVIISIAFFLHDMVSKKKPNIKITLLLVSFLLTMLYLLSVRISIVALIIVLLTFSFSLKSNLGVKKYLLLMILSLLPLLLFISPNFEKRFAAKAKIKDNLELSDVNSRLVHWQAVISTIKNNNVFFGAGTGDGHLMLYDEYLKYDFEPGFKYKYNAHNQYLEIMLYFGITGIVLLVLTILVILKKAIISRNFLGISIIFIFLTFMITESILERQSGIVSFVFMMSLIAITKEDSQKETIKPI